jgi:hypothetical protein
MDTGETTKVLSYIVYKVPIKVLTLSGKQQIFTVGICQKLHRYTKEQSVAIRVNRLFQSRSNPQHFVKKFKKTESLPSPCTSFIQFETHDLHEALFHELHVTVSTMVVHGKDNVCGACWTDAHRSPVEIDMIDEFMTAFQASQLTPVYIHQSRWERPRHHCNNHCFKCGECGHLQDRCPMKSTEPVVFDTKIERQISILSGTGLTWDRRYNRLRHCHPGTRHSNIWQIQGPDKSGLYHVQWWGDNQPKVMQFVGLASLETAKETTMQFAIKHVHKQFEGAV